MRSSTHHFRRFFYVTAAVLLLSGAAAVPTGPPPAATATGCQGQATSTTSDGLKLDFAAAPGAGGTTADPFDVAWDGPILWSGTTDKPVQKGHWSVTLEPVGGGYSAKAFAFAVSALANGPVENEKGQVSASGKAVLKDYVPTRLVAGTYKVSVDVSSASASCTGSAVIAITGNPLTTGAFVIAIILLLLGGTAVASLLHLLLLGGEGAGAGGPGGGSAVTPTLEGGATP